MFDYFLVFSFSVCLNGHSSGGAHAKLNDEEMFTYQNLSDAFEDVYVDNQPVLLLMFRMCYPLLEESHIFHKQMKALGWSKLEAC